MLLSLFFLAILFLLGTAFLNGFGSAFRQLYYEDPRLKFLKKSFFYGHLHCFFFPKQKYEGIFFATMSALNLSRFFYAVTALSFLISTGLFEKRMMPLDARPLYDFSTLWMILSVMGFVLLSFLISEYLPRILANRFPKRMMQISSPVASIFLLLAFPITYPCLKISRKLLSKGHLDPLLGSLVPGKKDLLELIQKANIGEELNSHEKKLIESVLTFQDRIVREIMVPRVDVFSLSAETSIKKAAKLIEEVGYSRVPVYRNTVDDITGVLMYKDIVNKYMEYEKKENDPSILESPIETIQKNVLYTPESKKISNLLEEFLRKKVHFAIVVDEYGGTEGIVTIEDILEEIVGEITDEYDEVEELFVPQPDGSWIVDARMSILDVEEQFGIQIPQEADYDTVGGYIFHVAGAIPSKGFVIHQEEFQMEILSSDERSVDKVRVKPVIPLKEEVEEIK